MFCKFKAIGVINVPRSGVWGGDHRVILTERFIEIDREDIVRQIDFSERRGEREQDVN